MAKHRRLTKLRITRIDLVDRGANQDADVLLIKRHGIDKGPLNKGGKSGKHDDMLDLTNVRKHTEDHRSLHKAVVWIEDIHDAVASAIKKQEDDEPKDRTFDEVLVQRSAFRVMQRVQEFAMVLDETIRRVVDNTKAEHTEQKIKDAVTSFVRAVKVDLPKFIDDSMKGMAKGDRDRLDGVVQIIVRGEPKMTDKKVDKKNDDDKKPTADMSLLRKMFAGMARAMGATDDDVRSIDPEPEGDIWKGVTPALRTRLEEGDRARAAEVKKREAAEARVAKLERDVTLSAVRKEVAGFKHMGLDPDKDAELFEKMTAGLSADEGKRMREIFRGADTAIEAGKLFAEVGKSGLREAPADSADAEIEKRVAAIMAKSEHKELTQDDAMDLVLGEDPALYERYRLENSIKV